MCNKTGGIYTVVKTKAASMKKHYKNYYLIGPWLGTNVEELDLKTPPAALDKAFKEAASQGLRFRYGSWLIEGEPNVILIDFSAFKSRVNEVKSWLWENYKVDSLFSAWDYNDPLVWGWAVGYLASLIQKYSKKKVLLHCHEWLAGSAILYARKHAPRIATVFTTHATMLGRSIAGSGLNLYEVLDKVNPEEEAKRLGVLEKHTTEKACANAAHVFTTVSEITSMEAEKLLNRKADVLLLNGLNTSNYPTLEETSLLHIRNRDYIREFIAYFFFPYYTFDLKHNLVFFTLGRYEFKNKGLDVFIDALGKLNDKLKKSNGKRTITVFVWVPMSHRGIRPEVLENKIYYDNIKNLLERNADDIFNNIIHRLISQKQLPDEGILDGQYLKGLEVDLKRFRRAGNPPLSTHLVDENDAIIKALLRNGLDNKPDDKVKVVLHPVYLNGSDQLLNLKYLDAISGGHLGVFPSAYEPWGYTPLESVSLGVPAVTTDVAGFGRYVKPLLREEHPGVFVLERLGKSYEEVVENLFQILFRFSRFDHAERVQNKINAKSISSSADWDSFSKFYVEAHKLALKRC